MSAQIIPFPNKLTKTHKYELVERHLSDEEMHRFYLQVTSIAKWRAFINAFGFGPVLCNYFGEELSTEENCRVENWLALRWHNEHAPEVSSPTAPLLP